MGQMIKNGRTVPVHRLRPNDTVWTPPSVIFLDTETHWQIEGAAEVHTMRLWVASHVDRRQVRKKAGPVTWGWGRTPDDLAEWIDGRTRGRDCVWLYAHNLNFDLAVSDLPSRMAAHGWSVSDFSVSQGAPWVRVGKGDRTLTVVDSWAWLPQSLESLATVMGDSKLPLPANEGGEYEWMGRCAKDVELLARSVLALMDWWDARRLGRWSISGAGSGWNAMRHVGSDVRHVIDPDPDLIAQDRQAVRGGRKDAAVVRSAQGGPWVEIDLEGAYPTVARELPLPVKRAYTFDALPLDSKWVDSRFYSPCAEVRVRCDRPRYPLRWGGVTWYPVGEFTTTLAGPEISAARAAGDLVAIGPGQMHKLGLALRPWATWVLDPSEGGEWGVPPVGRIACRAWGRSVLGKFAAHTHTAEAWEGAAPPGWRVTDSWDRRVGRRAAEVAMAGQAFYVTYDGDTENCYPAVLAWVESHVRRRLTAVLEALDGAWWTCDTDGLLVDLSAPIQWARFGMLRLGDHARDPFGLAQALCDALATTVAPLRLRPKKVFTSLAVLGPQHLTVDDQRRMSGVSAGAVEVAPGRFVARDWPKLKWQINNSRPGAYTRPERTATFNAPTVHRWVCDDGSTRPVEFRLAADGSNQPVPWAASRWRREGYVLAGRQYRLLERLA